MAHITPRALPSGDGEKMKTGRPTNDPRPLLRKENPLQVSSGGERHEGTKTSQVATPQQPSHNSKDFEQEGELFTYASEDEHGRHYRSCATEWGWKEDENQPP